MDLTVLIPLYNEEASLRELKERVASELDRGGYRGEILFVDDGSHDGSFEVIEEMAAGDDRVRAIKFRSNFGKAAALDAGFREARGRMVITMDADLQDDPAEIPKLIARLEEGYDVVSGWKKKRHDPITKTVPSKFFNLVTAAVTGIRIHDFNCGLKAYRAPVVREVRLYGELHRYIPALAGWKGFRVGEMVVTHHPRRHGRSKYGPKRFLAGFLDLLTVMLLTKFTVKPLHLFGLVGSLMGFGGVMISLYMVSLKIRYGDVQGRVPLLSFAVLLIIMGMQFLSTGLLAEMIASRRAGQETHYSIERRLGR
ncbi:MAG: glycosyltransferase family 2 protein [Candidatus Eisenbacteria bacterium]|nr:glycosyltransferase family 2 protein [Candidatus Eisenbacteria bacterium]